MSSHVKAAAPKVKGNISFKAANKKPVGKVSRTGEVAGGKRKRVTGKGKSNDDDEEDDPDSEADDEMTGDEGYSENEGEMDTDDELQAASKSGKSKKTAKRKRRATSPSSFGATLQNLLGNAEDEEDDDEEVEEDSQAGPSEKKKDLNRSTLASGQPAILSLAPHIRRGAQSSRLNEKAARIALAAKRKREDRARVIDVIGGWGAPGELPKTFEGDEKPIARTTNSIKDESENLQSWLNEGGVQGYEKRLRKSAQRGVVKLFNAIRAAQNTTEADVKEQDEEVVQMEKSSSKNDKSYTKPQNSGGIRTDNPLGGKSKAVTKLSKDNFFDLLRAGTKA